MEHADCGVEHSRPAGSGSSDWVQAAQVGFLLPAVLALALFLFGEVVAPPRLG